MNVEENRLRTFSEWPANAAVDAAQIAEAGFYYSGHGLKVQCFLCSVTISDWNYSDQAMARHLQASPNCPFARNPSSSCNVPLRPPCADEVGTEASAEALETHTIEAGYENDILLGRIRSLKLDTDFRTLAQRLRSFSNWPIPNIVSPEKLAKAGFYYLQHEDEVECVFCEGILKQWKADDDPDQEHRLHFPKCNFYMHRDDDDELNLTNVKLMPGTAADLTQVGIYPHMAPRAPMYSTYERRLETFSGWPENLHQTPEMLASAGFYYGAFGDNVRCFHCDGGLRNWEATDDAWIEHARWFPKCGFVNLVQGQEFIKKCINNRPPLDPSIFDGVDEVGATNTPPVSIVSPPIQEVTNLEVDRILHNPPKQTVNDIRQLNDTENNACSKSNIEKTNICANKENSNVPSNKQSNAIEKKTNVYTKDRATLEEENRRLYEARLCKICMDREVAIVFLPCGHLATCVDCAPPLTDCPMCRQEIRAAVRTFLS